MATGSVALSPEYLNADRGPKLDAISIVVFALAVLAVCLRFLSRIVIKAPFWWDDLAILVALFLAVGPFALTLHMVQHGFGKHAEAAGEASILTFLKCLYAFEIIYPLPIAATKFSILFYYRRIFQVPSFKLPLWIVAGLIGCWMIYVEGSAIFTCVPVQAMWDSAVTGRCIDIHKFFIGIAVPNVFTDLALLTMPLPYMWRLQIAIPKKIAIMFVFVLGGFVAVVSIIRLSVLVSLTNEDITWTYVPTCIWTNIEVQIGIVSASVPAFWPLLRALATGSVRPPQTQRSVDEPLSPKRLHNQPKRVPFRRANIEDEEGLMHLEDLPSDMVDQHQESMSARADPQEIGPPVPPKPAKPPRVHIWRQGAYIH